MAAKGSVSRVFVWIVLILLIVGLAGFGATSFGGSSSGLGQVGDTEITAEEYTRALQNRMRQIGSETGTPMTAQQARDMGVDRAVLRQLVSLAALEDEARDLGISVGDAELSETIRQMPAFQGPGGSFDRDAYRFALDRAGLSAADFEDELRAETARSILQGALVAAVQPPDLFVRTLYDYARQSRDLTIVTLTEGDLPEPLPEPTDAQVAEVYAANEAAFTLPERKAITYVTLSAEALMATVEVPEDEIRALYDARADQYDQPERRLVERLVFPDEAAAQSAADALAAGETDFDTLVEDRGLTLEDVDLGIVDRGDLGEAADAVFAVNATEVAGPAPSPVGPSLFRVNAALNAVTVPFEEVRDDLRAEVALIQAERDLRREIDPTEDLLAGGATLEEIAADTPFELQETVWHPDLSQDGLLGSDAFREAARQAQPGDFPAVEETGDGTLFALRVDDVLSPSLQPLEDVRDEAVAMWRADELSTRLTARAEQVATALREGNEPGAGDTRTQAGVLRDDVVDGVPQATVSEAFALEQGDVAVVSGPDGVAVVRVDAITAPDPDDSVGSAVRQSVAQAAGQGLAQDIATAFIDALERQKGIQLNQQAVNAVISSLN